VFPFALAAVAPPASYAAFEVAIATAVVVVGILDFGMAGSLTYFVLNRGRTAYVNLVRFHTVTYGAILLCFSLVGVVWRVDHTLIGVLMAQLCFQGLLSTLAKISGNATNAYLLDGMLYIVGLLLLALQLLIGYTETLEILMIGWLASAISLWKLHLTTLLKAKLRFSGLRKRYSVALRQAPFVAIASVLSVALAVSPRIFSDLVMDRTEVATLSFLLRLSAIGLVAHGFFQTLWFRQALASSREVSEATFIKLLTFTCFAQAAVMLFVLASAHLAPLYFNKFSFGSHIDVFLISSFTTVLWGIFAQQEALCTRSGVSRAMVPLLFVVLAGSAIVSLILDAIFGMTLALLTLVHCCAFFAAGEFQRFVLGEYGYSLRSAGYVSFTLLICSVIVFSLGVIGLKTELFIH
jgi:hypothetical protein